VIKLKRAYEKRSSRDGMRILVDRLWPRGITKKSAGIDLWLKDIAPTKELRQWFAHDPERWQQFQRRYKKELKQRKDGLTRLAEEASKGDITLVFAARDEERNNAVVLRDVLEGIIARVRRSAAGGSSFRRGPARLP